VEAWPAAQSKELIAGESKGYFLLEVALFHKRLSFLALFQKGPQIEP